LELEKLCVKPCQVCVRPDLSLFWMVPPRLKKSSESRAF